MHKRTPISTLAATFVILVFAPLSGDAQQHTLLSDRDLKSRVEHEVSEIDAHPMNVQVDVRDRVVTLTGTVPSLWAKNELLDEIADIDDVASIVSRVTIPAAEADRRIAEEVASNMRNYVFYSIYDDVTVSVNGGVVTLTGRVTSPHHAARLADLAARVRGVTDVRNEIRALPVSSFDDQLRYSIASRIYRDPLFWHYALQPDPPIHIVVEDGRVTLTGVVNSVLERRKAEHIARSTFGAFSVENRLRIESERQ